MKTQTQDDLQTHGKQANLNYNDVLSKVSTECTPQSFKPKSGLQIENIIYMNIYIYTYTYSKIMYYRCTYKHTFFKSRSDIKEKTKKEIVTK